MFLQSSKRISVLALGTTLSLNKFVSHSDALLWKSKAANVNMYTATYDANNPSEDRAVIAQTIQDWHLCAIFDGHGGWQVSEYVSKVIASVIEKNMKKNQMSTDFDFDMISNILIQTYTDIENDFISKIKQSFESGFGEVAKVGCCALVAMRNDKHLVTANCGDCRAILASQITGPSFEIDIFSAQRLTNDHNAREPLEQAKLFAEHPNEPDVVKCKTKDACYVKGRLQLTRALGDLYLKYPEFNGTPNGHRSRGRYIPDPYTPPYVSYIPEINHTVLTGKEKFLILATDGVWDYLSDQDAVDIVGRCKDRSLAADTLVATALAVAAKEAEFPLTEMLKLPAGNKRRMLHDDTTAIVYYLD